MKQEANYYFACNQEDDKIFDIHDLFQYYNGACTVKWTNRMTLCAGTCKNQGFGSSTISLSQPLLKFRSSNQVKETLIHQMIHAYLFKTNPAACRYEGGHGPAFKQIMYRINAITKLNISVYHTFHDQVQFYKKHIWRCTGRCKDQPPYFGYVKRSMNRAPQPADFWFKQHTRTCGGTFVKVSGPQKTIPQKNNNKGKKNRKIKQISQEKDHKSWGCGKTIQDYLKQMQKQSNNKKKQTFQKQQKSETQNNTFVSIEDYTYKQQKTTTNILIKQKKAKTIQEYCRQIQIQKQQKLKQKQKNKDNQLQKETNGKINELLKKYKS